MKQLKTTDAVGSVLCHDVTQIIPGEFKGPRFRKGHVIREEDVPVLLDMGKEHIYVWESSGDMLHEDAAAEILRELCQGVNMSATPPKEGKIELIAQIDGLFLADTARLRALNALGEIAVATRASGFPVKSGDKLCGARVIPLVIENEKMQRAKAVVSQGKFSSDTLTPDESSREESLPKEFTKKDFMPLMRLLPIMPKKYGIIATGSEVASGRIEDKFSPVVIWKMAEYGCDLIERTTPGDDSAAIAADIKRLLNAGAQMVICTGGMSVDPDDRTPLAIKNASDTVVSYGAPVLPGAMFMLAYSQGRPICGLPGCVMYAGRTVFDIVLPYLLADEPVTPEWLCGLGNGGLCLNCEDCRYPNCSFGKGV